MCKSNLINLHANIVYGQWRCNATNLNAGITWRWEFSFMAQASVSLAKERSESIE